MRFSALFTLLFFLGYSSLFAQDDGEKNTTPSTATRTIAMVKVSDSIYMLKGKSGNSAVFYGNDGVLLVDSQLASATAEIKNLIVSLSTKPIQYLVNTNHHDDNTDGNENFMNTGTMVIAHEKARLLMVQEERSKVEKAQQDEFNAMVDDLKASGNNDKAQEKAKEGFTGESAFDESQFTFPNITFSKDMTFHYNGEPVMIFHVNNAHTNGDSMVYFKGSNVLHTGDAFLKGSYPNIDISNGGSYDGYINGLRRILSFIDNETKVIPGHGDVASIDDVKKSLQMMKALKDRVFYNYLDKKSKEEILANKEITKEYDAQGFGDHDITTEQFVTLLYRMAKAKYGERK